MTNGTGPASGYPSEDDCRLADLIDLVSEKTDVADYPCASAVEQNVLIYDGARLRQELSRPAGRPRVETELARALLDGPGIVVLAGAFGDVSVDRATRHLDQPVGGLAPTTQADILAQAVADGWSRQRCGRRVAAECCLRRDRAR